MILIIFQIWTKLFSSLDHLHKLTSKSLISVLVFSIITSFMTDCLPCVLSLPGFHCNFHTVAAIWFLSSFLIILKRGQFSEVAIFCIIRILLSAETGRYYLILPCLCNDIGTTVPMKIEKNQGAPMIRKIVDPARHQ